MRIYFSVDVAHSLRVNHDDFNLALGRPLVTEVYEMGFFFTSRVQNGCLYTSSVQNGFIQMPKWSHDFVPVAEVVHVPEVVDVLEDVQVPVE
ncbi:unnamed protein product [Prunus armeniaca]